jgi:hypothetical protein
MTMAYDETFLSNQALTYVGSPHIPSWDGMSNEAIQCEQLFPLARDMTLAMHPWGFADRDETLTPVPDTETYTGWNYAYLYPAECLAFRKIINPAEFNTDYNRGSIRGYDKMVPLKWKTKINVAESARRIVTNQAEAEGNYTTRIETLELWSIPALKALAYVLAAELVVILKGDTVRQKYLMDQAMLATGWAEGQDADEQEDMPDDSSALSISRL